MEYHMNEEAMEEEAIAVGRGQAASSGVAKARRQGNLLHKTAQMTRINEDGEGLSGESEADDDDTSVEDEAVALVVAEEVEVEAVVAEFEILSFVWPKHNPVNGRKKFKIRWINTGEEAMGAAMQVMSDMPHEAVKVIWEGHKNNGDVREWVDKAAGKFIKQWSSIVQYAREMEWAAPTTTTDTAAATTTTTTSTTAATTTTATAATTAATNTVVPTTTTVPTDTATTRAATTTTDDAATTIPTATTTATTTTTADTTIPTAPTTATSTTTATYTANTATTTSMAQGCAGFHDWECCDRAAYVSGGVLKPTKVNGRLEEKKCSGCNIRFVATPQEGGMVPTQKGPVYHCVTCKKAMCIDCKREVDIASPPRGTTRRRRR